MINFYSHATGWTWRLTMTYVSKKLIPFYLCWWTGLQWTCNQGISGSFVGILKKIFCLIKEEKKEIYREFPFQFLWLFVLSTGCSSYLSLPGRQSQESHREAHRGPWYYCLNQCPNTLFWIKFLYKQQTCIYSDSQPFVGQSLQKENSHIFQWNHLRYLLQ